MKVKVQAHHVEKRDVFPGEKSYFQNHLTHGRLCKVCTVRLLYTLKLLAGFQFFRPWADFRPSGG